MDPEQWQQIKILLHSALERAPVERPKFLDQACSGDPTLRSQLEALLASHERTNDFIELPAFEVMADILADEQRESLVGRTIGRYQILEQLGAGGMGEVYLAEDKHLLRKVALKVLPAFFTRDRERVRRFQQEARAASALNHPNILTIYEIGQIDSHQFIATEFVEGDTLRQRMIKSPMSMSELLGLATQIASALTAAHQTGIVHRDIKTENIMLREDGIVKVLDFGLAKLIAGQSGESEASTMLRTQPGVIMGTPHYMSPEQARGLKVDARTDIWSLGVLLYEMVGGRVPFAGETSSDVNVSILEKEPPPLARFTPQTPEVLQWIVTKALRKQTEQRYQSAKDLLTDLQSLKHRLEFENEVKEWKTSEQAIAKTANDSGAVLVKASDEKQLLDSVAILPMSNESGDPGMEYFSDGITESIINALSQLPRLRVVARSTVFRYKGSEVDPQEVGQQLGARAVLTGRVRQVGDGLVIAAELIDVTIYAHLWGERCKRELSGVFDLQDKIAEEISERLRLKLTGHEKKRLGKRYTANAAAYQLYLRGRYFWYKRTEEALRKSIEYFNQAIAEDPSYAAAYAGISDSYTLLALRGIIAPREGLLKAKAAARKALEIDDSLGEAHASLAHVRLHDWDWSGLEEKFKRALELNPGHAIAYHWYAEYLMAMGRADESIAIAKQAQEKDPLSPVIIATLGLALFFARKYDQATEQFRNALELDPNNFLSHYRLGHIYSQEGLHREAIEEAQKSVALSGRSTETLAGLAQAYAAAGISEEMQKILDELNERSKERYVSPYYVAKIYALAGEKEQTLAWLEKAYDERNPDFIELKVEPALDSLRTDERFRDLLRRVGLAPAESFPAAQSTSTALKSTWTGPSRKRTAGRAINSLAILPLVNTSADPNMDYLSDGITESIINSLSQLPKLRVLARSTVFRYKGRDVDPQQAGRELGVQAVLTGRVLQIGERLLIGTELVDVSDGSQLWGEQNHRAMADIFELQEEISGHISEALRLKVSGPQKKRLTKRHTRNAQAYELYLRGCFFFNKRTEEDANRGIEYFQQALSLDPNFALAYTGLADCQILLGDVGVQALPPKETFLQGQGSAARALELDDALAEAHGTLGHVSMHLFDWPRAEKELRRALELNPNIAQACLWQAYYLAFTGQFEDSIASINCALQLDPLALPVNTSAAELLYFAGRFDESIDQFHKSIEMDAHYPPAHLELARVYEHREMYDDALAEFAKARELSRDNPESLASLAHCYAVSGATADAQKLLLELTEMSECRYVSSYDLALIHHGLGQKEECFEWLNRAYEIHDGWVIYITVDPRWQSLRGDARFSRIVRLVGLAPAESFPSAHATETVQKSPRTAMSLKRTSRKAIKSLAILPFMNTGADPNMDYLSDGITESIINALSQLPKLRVVARNTVFRYKGREVESNEVGHALDVQAVLTGRVHQVGDTLNIGAELIDVESDSQLWGESYNRRPADIFEMQAEIAREIAETLRLKLSGEDKDRLIRRYTENAEAYQLYLKGRYHWNKRTIERLEKGLECFQQAIALDPNYALAYAGISDCRAFRGDAGLAAVPSKDAFAMAKQAALRALEIDNTLAEAYASLAHANMHCFEWADAEAAFKSAIKFNANHAQAHQWYAFYLLFNAQSDKAISEAKRALELDPLSLTAHGDLGQIFHYTRQYDRAIDLYQKALELEPNRHRVYLWLGWVFEQQKKYDEAIGAFQKALFEDSNEPLASLGCAYALAGRTEDARNVLKQLNELSASRYVSPYQMSLL